MIRTLLFSTLYPSSVRPTHGIFVETRLRRLLASGKMETRVVAPLPWFPFRHKIFGEYARYAAVPSYEERNGIRVEHPRYLLLPKIGMNGAPYTLARAGLAAARRLIAEGFDFDLIDAHYFYPDGVAATIIGKTLNKPAVITARGTDINLIPQFDKPRRLILQAAEDCAAIITVSAALKARLVQLGVHAEKVTVLRNGVDLDVFRPEDREMARARLGVSRYALASVGNLIAAKGHDLVIRAVARLPDVELLIVGSGPEEKHLMRLAVNQGVGDRVTFLGAIPQDQLWVVYSAVDCLVLASMREGWPNVLLEAMACGTPVIASDVGGIPEIVMSPEAGIVMEERSVDGITSSVTRLRQTPPARAATRAYAERFSWDVTTQGQCRLFSEILDHSAEAGDR